MNRELKNLRQEDRRSKLVETETQRLAEKEARRGARAADKKAKKAAKKKLTSAMPATESGASAVQPPSRIERFVGSGGRQSHATLNVVSQSRLHWRLQT